MKLESSVFEHNGQMPPKYTCDGLDVNPPLRFLEVPPEAKSMALIVEDPDAPSGVWVHWLLWNIEPDVEEIDEDEVPEGAIEGVTNFDERGYGGPCPPDGDHRYFFKLFALDTKLELSPSGGKDQLENAMEHHIIAEAELVGRYT